jgi:hypothetical protein
LGTVVTKKPADRIFALPDMAVLIGIGAKAVLAGLSAYTTQDISRCLKTKVLGGW